MAFINDVAPGQVISSATWGNRIRDQVISTVANLAAAPGSPVEGQHIYTQDTDMVHYYDGASWCPLAGQCIARGNRTTSSSTTTSEVGVLRLDDIPLKAGQLYIIQTSSMFLGSTTSGDGIGATLRYTIDGSTPNPTTSTRLASIHALAGSSSPALPLIAKYIPGSNLDFSVVLTVVRWSGSGTVSMGTDANHPDIDLMIIAAGAAPADTGTDI